MVEAQSFFLVAVPGLEDLVRAELREWYPDLEATVEHGGVALNAPLAVGLGLNFALKTPTRILWRIAQFRVRDFPKLYNKISLLPWNDWLVPSAQLDIQVATRLSRLKIKKRIEESCLEGYRKARGITAGPRATLFVRIHEDECTLSLDTSGERLHKRGDRTHIGEAPLRETLAAALIQLVSGLDSAADSRAVEVFDPMVGSGTFLLEAAGRDELVEGRNFGLSAFTSREVTTPKRPSGRATFTSFVGWDTDASTLKAAQSNSERAGIKIRLDKQNIFVGEPLDEVKARRWVFVNPPYDERLKVCEPLGDYYAKLFAAVERVSRAERACFILAAKAVKGKFKLPGTWRVLAKRPFTNGGIPVVAFVFG